MPQRGASPAAAHARSKPLRLVLSPPADGSLLVPREPATSAVVQQRFAWVFAFTFAAFLFFATRGGHGRGAQSPVAELTATPASALRAPPSTPDALSRVVAPVSAPAHEAAAADAHEAAAAALENAAPAPLTAPRTWTRLVVLTHTLSPDSIGWSGSPPHVKGDERLCLRADHAIFGAQCTMHRSDAVRACLRLAGCEALTAPDTAPYEQPRSEYGSTGPLAQARSVPSAIDWLGGETLERAHGMCAPTGCESVFVTRVPAAHVARALGAAVDAALARVPGWRGELVVVGEDTLPAWREAWGVNGRVIARAGAAEADVAAAPSHILDVARGDAAGQVTLSRGLLRQLGYEVSTVTLQPAPPLTSWVRPPKDVVVLLVETLA
jgi:hypothetical protein